MIEDISEQGFSYFVPDHVNPAITIWQCGCNVLYYFSDYEDAMAFRDERKFEAEYYVDEIERDHIFSLAEYNECQLSVIQRHNEKTVEFTFFKRNCFPHFGSPN